MSSQAEAIVPVEPRLSDTDIQDMLAKSVRLYAERAAEREAGYPPSRPTPRRQRKSW